MQLVISRSRAVAPFLLRSLSKHAVFLLVLLAGTSGAWAQRIDVAGGALSPAALTVPLGPNSGTLTLTGFYGIIIRYEADYGNGSGFVEVGPAAQKYTFTDLQKTARFRAIVRTPSNVFVTSAEATVTVRELRADEKPVKPVFENRQASFAPALALKFSPLATQDPIASTLMLGVEYRLSPQYGVEASYGHQFSALRVTTMGLIDNRQDYEYRKFKLELRRYLLPRTKNPNQETYLAVQTFFTPLRYTRYDGNFYRVNRYVAYDRAYVQRDVAGIGLKIGSLWHLRNHWLVEAGLGAGGRYVDVRYDMLNEHRLVNNKDSQANFFNQIERPGTNVTIDVELVFKVGYILGLNRSKPAAEPAGE